MTLLSGSSLARLCSFWLRHADSLTTWPQQSTFTTSRDDTPTFAGHVGWFDELYQRTAITVMEDRLTINKEYARRYAKKKEAEELSRRKTDSIKHHSVFM